MLLNFLACKIISRATYFDDFKRSKSRGLIINNHNYSKIWSALYFFENLLIKQEYVELNCKRMKITIFNSFNYFPEGNGSFPCPLPCNGLPWPKKDGGGNFDLIFGANNDYEDLILTDFSNRGRMRASPIRRPSPPPTVTAPP